MNRRQFLHEQLEKWETEAEQIEHELQAYYDLLMRKEFVESRVSEIVNELGHIALSDDSWRTPPPPPRPVLRLLQGGSGEPS